MIDSDDSLCIEKLLKSRESKYTCKCLVAFVPAGYNNAASLGNIGHLGSCSKSSIAVAYFVFDS